MRWRQRGLCAAIAVHLVGGCVVPVLLPGSRVEMSPVFVSEQEETATRFAAGAHLSSTLLRANQHFDVGVGVVSERRGKVPSTAPHVGAYVEASVRPWIGVAFPWLSLRASWLRHPSQADAVSDGVIRLSWEIDRPVEGAAAHSDAHGVVFMASRGRLGVGAFVESGVRMEGERRAFVTTAGISVRLPALAGLVISFGG